MERIKFRIHPLFLVFGLISFCVGLGYVFLCYLLAALLHELGHALIAKKLGYHLEHISLLPFGAELNLENDNFTANDEIKIAIAGPLVNLFLIIFCMALWWIFPITYYYTDLFVFTNFITFIFNFLPVFPLDGGRIFRALISKKYDVKNTERIVSNTAIFLSSLFFLVFIISLFITPLYSMAIASIFLLTGAFNFNKNAVYKRILQSKDLQKSFKKGCNVNIVAVSDSIPLFKLVKFLNIHNYTIFVIYDSTNTLKKVIMEKDLSKLFIQYESFILLKDIK